MRFSLQVEKFYTSQKIIHETLNVEFGFVSIHAVKT